MLMESNGGGRGGDTLIQPRSNDPMYTVIDTFLIRIEVKFASTNNVDFYPKTLRCVLGRFVYSWVKRSNYGKGYPLGTR